MAKTLVVDDSKVDQTLAASLLEEAGHEVLLADDGRAALEAVKQDTPDIVVTDLQMPEMDGLELVEALRAAHPAIPVILMTAHGSEETAVEALKRGAASYVPKRHYDELVPTVSDVIELARARQAESRVLGCMTLSEHQFVLQNEPSDFRALVGLFRRQLECHRFVDSTVLTQMCVALDEALANALHHGNLEVDSDLRERGLDLYHEAIEERRRMQPYCDRRIHVTARFTHDEAVYTIRDEGPGFDPTGVPDPRSPENLEKASGRGLLLITTFMDDVGFNSSGTEIMMRKRRQIPA